eukprot:TRINITY_DN22972_c0_g1_i1.p1 TRINITY_DN22972_c0_g1~~TRINITY_DN22972_c0_g1_i1.p1  ORF type:complete len:1069 (+),score=228.76 TRINITY_DN22972_c0_g1_i1:66-3272(+)
MPWGGAMPAPPQQQTQELLAALSGYPGELIIRPPGRGRCTDTWKLHKNWPLESGPRAMAEELLAVGVGCMALRRGTEALKTASVWCGLFDPSDEAAAAAAEGNGVGLAAGSVYSHALCHGFSAALDEYDQVICELYTEAEQRELTIAELRGHLGQWQAVFGELNALLTAITSKDLRSANFMLYTIHDAASRWGDAQKYLMGIARSCSEVTVRLLSHWAALGQLPDGGHTAFFLRPAEGALYGEVPTRRGPLQGYYAEVDQMALPSDLSEQTVSEVLRAGELTRMFHANAASGDTRVPEDAAELERCLQSSSIISDDSVVGPAVHNSMVIAQQVAAFRLSAQVRDCSPAGWQLPYYLRVIGDYFLCQCGALWRPFVALSAEATAELLRRFIGLGGRQYDSGLPAELSQEALTVLARRAQRKRADAFLQSRNGLPLARLPGHPEVSIREVQRDGGKAAAGSESVRPGTGEQVQVLMLARRKVKESGNLNSVRCSESASIFSDIVSRLHLELPIAWPLSDLLPREPMAKLQQVFQNVMHIMHTEAVLTECSRLLTLCDRLAHAEVRGRGPRGARWLSEQAAAQVRLGQRLLRKLLDARRKMAFFFENLKVFIMTDVIHTQLVQLEKDVLDGRGYRGLQLALAEGLSNIARHACFLDRDGVSIGVNLAKAVRSALEFWIVIKSALGWIKDKIDFAPAMMQLSLYRDAATSIAGRFDASTAAFFRELRKESSVTRAAIYAPLLRRLDYNGFYSRVLAHPSEPQLSRGGAPAPGETRAQATVQPAAAAEAGAHTAAGATQPERRPARAAAPAAAAETTARPPVIQAAEYLAAEARLRAAGSVGQLAPAAPRIGTGSARPASPGRLEPAAAASAAASSGAALRRYTSARDTASAASADRYSHLLRDTASSASADRYSHLREPIAASPAGDTRGRLRESIASAMLGSAAARHRDPATASLLGSSYSRLDPVAPSTAGSVYSRTRDRAGDSNAASVLDRYRTREPTGGGERPYGTSMLGGYSSVPTTVPARRPPYAAAATPVGSAAHLPLRSQPGAAAPAAPHVSGSPSASHRPSGR